MFAGALVCIYFISALLWIKSTHFDYLTVNLFPSQETMFCCKQRHSLTECWMCPVSKEYWRQSFFIDIKRLLNMSDFTPSLTGYWKSLLSKVHHIGGSRSLWPFPRNPHNVNIYYDSFDLLHSLNVGRVYYLQIVAIDLLSIDLLSVAILGTAVLHGYLSVTCITTIFIMKASIFFTH